jgi:hypothetical protein
MEFTPTTNYMLKQKDKDFKKMPTGFLILQTGQHLVTSTYFRKRILFNNFEMILKWIALLPGM